MTQQYPAHAPINPNLMRIATVMDSIVPDDPNGGRALRAHREMIIVGCMYEMAKIRPSLPEMAAVIGTCHTTIKNHLQRWQDQPWRDRYGWMLLAERRISDGQNPVDAPLL